MKSEIFQSPVCIWLVSFCCGSLWRTLQLMDHMHVAVTGTVLSMIMTHSVAMTAIAARPVPVGSSETDWAAVNELKKCYQKCGLYTSSPHWSFLDNNRLYVFMVSVHKTQK